MSDRVKILGMFAVLGFVGGIVANIGYKAVWPWLAANFEFLFASSEWIISGLAGAMITTFFVVIWVYLSRSNE